MDLKNPHTKFFKELAHCLAPLGQQLVNANNYVQRSVVIDRIQTNDQEVIKAIIHNDYLRKNFTSDVNGTLVFNSAEFITALRQREYSYDGETQYRNFIGLTIDRRPIDDYAQENVELDFPYKDTVLKAGMSTTDVKHSNEPYLNKIIAKDEIIALTEPKAFCNTKQYGDIDPQQPNLLIKGNNLIALNSLASRYTNKIKLIYMDVPYYFKENKETDTFAYNSNFKLSTWLTFMENRLQAAFELLQDDGSIWIHVGEDGMHYLKVLCDQIFGVDRFVGTLPRKTRSGKSDVPFNFSQDFDWILVYTKTTNSDTAIVGRRVNRKYYETPDFPGRKWRTADLSKQTTTAERPNSDFTMVNPKTGKKYPVNPNRSWAVTKDTFQEYYDAGGIGFPDDYDFMKGEKPFRRVFKDEDDKKKKSSVASDLLLKDFIKTLMNNAKTTKKDEFVKKQEFNYAKPEELMKAIISVTTDEGDLVMDCFSGSGTTAAVAHKMNRHYIAVEQIDNQLKLSEQRLINIINGQDKGGITKEVGWKQGGGFIYTELANKRTKLIDQVNVANSVDDVWKLIRNLKANDYQLNIQLSNLYQNNELVDLAAVKQAVVDILEPTQLYVQAANVNDPDEEIAPVDRQFTHDFYAGKELKINE